MPKFTDEPLTEYPAISILDFLAEVSVAFAVCDRDCGQCEFIVDEQTQGVSIVVC